MASSRNLIQYVDDATIASARAKFQAIGLGWTTSHGGIAYGDRSQLEVSPNLWAGVGLVRGGAGTALVGDPETVAACAFRNMQT